ncbi:PrsW family intramembrane metalloprotease [Halorarius halobius]|uniref:PrsW family intramembrane metalloprotease n=1 Tax=Halorarius halobius TaxID=2962671 RepID=UPI0020CE88F7|nr:PrsW family glutamic-type intramembrane protease [Halorarius halobius]
MGNGDSDTDPVAAHTDRETYEVTGWEPRTATDRVAVSLHGLLRRTAGAVLVLVAALLLVGQLSIIGFAMYRNPTVGLLTAVSVLPAVVLVGAIWYGDATMREPWTTLAATFVLAVLFAAFAALANSVLGPVIKGLVPVVGTALYFYLVVAPIEETVKWLSPRVYAFNTDSFDAVVDGAVYGAVAGLGFATIENALYITQSAIQQGSISGPAAIERAIRTAGTRAFVGPGHVIWSAISGYYLGLAKFDSENAGPIVVKGLLVAALAHATYNTAVSYLPRVGIELTGLMLLVFVVVYDGIFAYYLYRKISKYRDAYEASVPDDAATSD